MFAVCPSGCHEVCDCGGYPEYPEYKDSVACDVVNAGCKAPPALAFSNTKAECFACGLPVCTACSSRRQYQAYGIKRICAKCQEQYGMKGGRKFPARRTR